MTDYTITTANCTDCQFEAVCNNRQDVELWKRTHEESELFHTVEVVSE